MLWCFYISLWPGLQINLLSVKYLLIFAVAFWLRVWDREIRNHLHSFFWNPRHKNLVGNAETLYLCSPQKNQQNKFFTSIGFSPGFFLWQQLKNW
jgi:hypothetical protein